MKNGFKRADELLSIGYHSVFPEKKALLTFLFHVLFKDKKEISKNLVRSQQAITTDVFRAFIDYYLQSGYRFVSPSDIVNGLDPDRNSLLITFDDGYFNNFLALPILKEFNVPAVLFPSTQHIVQSRGFWFDVVHRERSRRNTSLEKIRDELEFLKKKKHQDIEEYLLKTFGSESLRPLGDIDRPMSTDELASFANEPLISIGNHTTDHAVLTNYAQQEIIHQIQGAQRDLLELTGVDPLIISYPNGNYSEAVITSSKACGLKLGITVDNGKNYLPLPVHNNALFRLKRFTLLGNKPLKRQCQYFSSDLQFINRLKQ